MYSNHNPIDFYVFFTKGKKIIVTNGFIKKTKKLPLAAKISALNYMTNYLERIQKRTYYE